MNFILFFYVFKLEIILYQSYLYQIPVTVKMTGACQSAKGYCNLFIEPQIISFLVL